MISGEGSYNDYTALGRVFCTRLITSERQLLDAGGVFVAHDLPRLVWGDVDILVSQLSFGRRRINGLWQLLALRETHRGRETVDRLGLLVPLPTSQEHQRFALLSWGIAYSDHALPVT